MPDFFKYVMHVTDIELLIRQDDRAALSSRPAGISFSAANDCIEASARCKGTSSDVELNTPALDHAQQNLSTGGPIPGVAAMGMSFERYLLLCISLHHVR